MTESPTAPCVTGQQVQKSVTPTQIGALWRLKGENTSKYTSPGALNPVKQLLGVLKFPDQG